MVIRRVRTFSPLLLSSPWTSQNSPPGGGADLLISRGLHFATFFGVSTPKMVLGHNLHCVAPFEIPRVAFCTVLRHASFVLSCPEADRIWIPPGRHFGPGTISGQFLGPGKHTFEEIILWWGYRGISPAQMNSTVPGIHLGVLLCLKTP